MAERREFLKTLGLGGGALALGGLSMNAATQRQAWKKDKARTMSSSISKGSIAASCDTTATNPR